MAEYSNYGSTRFKFDRRRDIVWKEITRYLSPELNNKNLLVELGSGYCNWINNVRAHKRIAIDKYLNPKSYCTHGVEPIFGDFLKIKSIADNSVDTFLASNFFEHLSKNEFKSYLEVIRKKLAPGGKIIIIQPNYYYAYRNYFDDFTHESVWSHESLKDFILANNFKILRLEKKFLPFSMKSKFPANKFLIRFYLHSFFKPLAGQMLLIAGK